MSEPYWKTAPRAKFVEARDLLDLPEDDLIEFAVHCSNKELALHSEFLLRKKAARDGKRLRMNRKGD